jgi:hypothetical protein
MGEVSLSSSSGISDSSFVQSEIFGKISCNVQGAPLTLGVAF